MCEWLSKILETEVVLIRAQKDRLMTLDLEKFDTARPEDRRMNFITEGAIHLVNNQSMQSLVMAMYNKY